MFYLKQITELKKLIKNGKINRDDIVSFDRCNNGIISDIYIDDTDKGEKKATVFKLLQEMMIADSATGFVTLQDWALLNGLNESWARRKCASGYIKSAFKMGKQWLIDPTEENQDNRFKK